MRGFTQNIRNGNSFAVLNNELRWPIIKYLMNRPIHSDLLENFQLIGFFDVGTAWSGSSPYSKQNAYNNEIIRNGPITIVIDKDRQPIVYGYGFGLRSRLLGYFIRADWAWGIENNVILPKIFYLSLSLDF
jgi:outer membrane protein assembly factor BamA